MFFRCFWACTLLACLWSCSETPAAQEDALSAEIDSLESLPQMTLPSSRRALEILHQTSDEEHEDPMEMAEAYRKEYQLSEALGLYNQILTADPKNYPALWKKSITIAEMGFMVNTSTLKLSYFVEAARHAQRALAIDPEGIGANFAMAMAMSRMESISDGNKKITYAVKMKKHAEKVLQADPTYHYAWYLLGSWHYDFSGLDDKQYKVAQSLFGTSEMEKASYESALEYFHKALAMEPDNVIYNYHAAMTYMQLDEDDLALQHFSKAVHEPISADQEEAMRVRLNNLIQAQGETIPRVGSEP